MRNKTGGVRRAMTLIETMMVLGILSVVGLVLIDNIYSFYKNNTFLLEETDALSNGRQGLTDIVKAVRQASYGDDGAYPIAEAATSSITVYTNSDTDTSIERIRYVLSGTVLSKVVTNSSGNPPSYAGQPQSTTSLALYMRNGTSTPLFTYYDANGVQLSTTSTDISKISSVSIQMRVDINPSRAPNVFTLTEQATLRNLRSN